MSSIPAHQSYGQVNPSLLVDAYFLVRYPGELRRTQVNLGENPEVAAWLLSFLDYLLFKQGKLQGERAIAHPPSSGSAFSALVRGGVILPEERPDGRQSLRLNPAISELGLYLYARVRGGPALDVAVSLGEDPEFTRWLLTYFLGGAASGESRWSESLAGTLRQRGVLIDELPAEPARFPDPLDAADPVNELADMSAIFFQAAGQPVPAEVLRVLDRHVPALPAGTALVWGRDAGTGLIFPSLAPQGSNPALSASFRGANADRRAAMWSRQLDEARNSMRTRRYAVLREILPAAQRQALRRYVRQLVERGYFPQVGIDKQVELRRSIYRQQTLGSLHNALAKLLSDVYGQPLIGSFNQIGLYEAGSELLRHKDRPQCVLNLSLVLDMQGPEGDAPPWPIFMELDGKCESVGLEIGDGLAYSGIEVTHWRDPLPVGQRAIVAFYFFVPENFSGSLD